MGQSDHYAMLGVERSADKKTIKRAYFDLAAKLHPDRYFRKKLGSFRLRMEAVFARVTVAHDTLTVVDKRAEYDAYLEAQRRSRSIEDLLADALAEVQRAEAAVEKEAAAEEARHASSPLPPSPSSGSQPVAAPVRSTSPVPSPARRDALAARLLAGRPRPPSGPQVPVTPTPAAPRPSANDAMASLRRRYEDRKASAKAAHARGYVSKAREALAAGDAVSAANAMRVASTLDPDDPDVQREAKELQAKADTILAETYEKQAIYEERQGQWAEAARSWMRVARARPGDAAAHDRGANAFVRAEGDLHEARELAQRACVLDPTNGPYRATLASVYLAAGLHLNAKRELETAAQLAPQDVTIQALLKRVDKSA